MAIAVSGRPDKLAVIFGRRINKQYRGQRQTGIEDLHWGNPVMRSYYKNGFAEHYGRDHDVLRFELPAAMCTLRINKAVVNRVPLREKLQAITERYQNVDILQTFPDRGELRNWGSQLYAPTASAFPGSNWTMLGNWR